MGGELGDKVALGGIPESGDAVLGSGGDPTTLRRERDVMDRTGVNQRGDRRAALSEIPDLGLTCRAAGDDPRAVGTEPRFESGRHTGQRGGRRKACPGVPDRDGWRSQIVVPHGRNDEIARRIESRANHTASMRQGRQDWLERRGIPNPDRPIQGRRQDPPPLRIEAGLGHCAQVAQGTGDEVAGLAVPHAGFPMWRSPR